METKQAFGVLFLLSLLLIEGTEDVLACTKKESRKVNT